MASKPPEVRQKISEGQRRHYEANPQARERLSKIKRREALERLASLDAAAVTHKKCTECGEIKPLEGFSIRRTKLKCGLVAIRPESACRKCCAARSKRNKERRIAEGRENSTERRREWWEKRATPEQKRRRREKERERAAIRRREEGIPPRNFKKRRRQEVPVEPAALLVEVLKSLGHSAAEIALRSGVPARRLRGIETLESPTISIDQVDKILIAFERQDDLNELYPPSEEPERLIGWKVLDPEGVLKDLPAAERET